MQHSRDDRVREEGSHEDTGEGGEEEDLGEEEGEEVGGAEGFLEGGAVFVEVVDCG